MLTHANLAANLEMIRHTEQPTPESVCVGWLPPYHDMGLIGILLYPIYVGSPCITMSPLHFLQQPLRWLVAISRYRATMSAAPNFALDLCARKVTDAQRDALDLSSMRHLCLGAEPIDPQTIARFFDKFGPCGLPRGGVYPCYGLAEATLIVSGGEHRAGPRIARFEKASLAAARALPSVESGTSASMLVDCGRAMPGEHIVIIDRRGEVVPSGTVGEICVSGPNVAAGYWNRPEETSQTFVTLNGIEGRFLRTGDLGFLDADGALFITGRCKDVLVVRGRNLYPQDIERSAEGCHPAVRQGCSAAVLVHDGSEEGIALIAEVDLRYHERRRSNDVSVSERRSGVDRRRVGDDGFGVQQTQAVDPSAVVDAIIAVVAEVHGVRLREVILIRPQTIYKTSSGKVQRRACREALEQGSLERLIR
jgi:acyl-CoA synthetase (AMP-forming)/AMP-acid ligase II